MFGLIPKEEKFFQMFQAMGGLIVDGAKLLKEMLDNYGDPLASQQAIKEIEHRADIQTHEIINKLNTSFITPFDREDIYSLAGALDDIIDLIDCSAQRFVMYNVEATTAEARELSFLILQGAETINRALVIMGGKLEPIAEYCVQVNALENEADRVCREAISRLFDEEKDPIQLIKWKEIYETLEKATDKCEDAANILESVVVKNA
jgi:predicted phosphate transport protein (TIGR00153 family)